MTHLDNDNPQGSNSTSTEVLDTQRRTEIASIVTSHLSPLGKLEAIDALFDRYASSVAKAELDKLDDELYDLGSVNWGEATKESEAEWGKNHADLWIPTRDVHKTISARIAALNKETS